MTIVLVVILFLVFVGSIVWFFTTDSDVVEICMLFSITLSLIFAIGLTAVGCCEGWTEEERNAHYMQERTELVEELKAAKNSDYMKYLLHEKIEKFNKAHEDDIKLIIDFDAVLKGEAE